MLMEISSWTDPKLIKLPDIALFFFFNRKVSLLKGKQVRLALVAKTSSQEDVCGICTMRLLLILEALSKSGATAHMYLESQ